MDFASSIDIANVVALSNATYAKTADLLGQPRNGSVYLSADGVSSISAADLLPLFAELSDSPAPGDRELGFMLRAAWERALGRVLRAGDAVSGVALSLRAARHDPEFDTPYTVTLTNRADGPRVVLWRNAHDQIRTKLESGESRTFEKTAPKGVQPDASIVLVEDGSRERLTGWDLLPYFSAHEECFKPSVNGLEKYYLRTCYYPRERRIWDVFSASAPEGSLSGVVRIESKDGVFYAFAAPLQDDDVRVSIIDYVGLSGPEI